MEVKTESIGDESTLTFSVKCEVCGNPVKLNGIESARIFIGKIPPTHICNECKEAIMFARKLKQLLLKPENIFNL